MKKITSIILTVIIALSCVSLIGYADDAAGLTDFAVSVAFDGEKLPKAHKITPFLIWFYNNTGKVRKTGHWKRFAYILLKEKR